MKESSLHWVQEKVLLSVLFFVCLFSSLSRVGWLSVDPIVDMGVLFASSPYLGLSG